MCVGWLLRLSLSGGNRRFMEHILMLGGIRHYGCRAVL
ncbi:hypothetical protein AcetOrient_orf04112 [Acetobacter orientalis]|uniref:Uncharacterized protein n=1 Tax=Acetobacter orientalis TaxID=146474 RepID=A0A2Z5ZLX9_9PROT|nr:hypothetical protein AcetOrient_orf04112 [Acetobacter orientalis]